MSAAVPIPASTIFDDRFSGPPAPQSLCDYTTQASVLAELMAYPELLESHASDLAVTDFHGDMHQSLFRAMLSFSREGKAFDAMELIQRWDTGNVLGDRLAYLADLANYNFVQGRSIKNLRVQIERLHKFAHLRRLRFFGESVQRQAENAKADPHELLQRIGVGIDALRDGYDINGQLLPYAPRNLNRRPDLVTLSSVEAKPVPWLWRPYLSYGMINMLSGEPGAGKTFLALAIAAALTVGKIPFTGEEITPLDVVYLSKENSIEYSVRPRFDILQGDPSRCHMLQGAVSGEGPKARREGVRLTDIPVLESALKQTKARFLVVDPIQSYLGGEVDMHRSNETRPILDGLATLVEKYGVCLLMLRHFAKSTTGSAINRGLGTIDLTGAARTELHAGRHHDQCAMVHAKTNIGELGKAIGYEIKGEGLFRWTGETSITANDLAGNALAEEDRDALAEAADILADALRGGPKLTTDVLAELRAAGVSEKTARRAKSKLGVKNRKRGGSDGRWEWALDE